MIERDAPDITVVVTVYKRCQYLRDALDSVRLQSLEGHRLEVIVADDGASPDVGRIIEDLGQSYMHYRPNGTRMGVALSVREALRSARGRYVAIMNDDDLWERDFLRELIAPLDADPGRVMAFCDHWIIDENGSINPQQSDTLSRRFRRAQRPGGEVDEVARATVLDRTVPLAVGAIFRRDAIDPDLITEEVGGAYDYWIACLLARSGGPFYYVPRRLTRYRWHSNMETLSRRIDRRHDEVFILGALLDRGWFPNLRWALRWRLSSALFLAGANKLLRFGLANAARSDFARGLRVFPNPFCVAGLLASLLPPALLRGILSLAERTESVRTLVFR
ncbi:MAG TPA: glycosyltransferase [Acetobacteraceae bacterium]|jgi:glycosyltransferase involved in cell wall biosynthesis|nr:glycosyltransferase [Acetobacteraceae bacterium]